MKLKFTTQAQAEQKQYNLLSNAAYVDACNTEINAARNRFRRYNYYINNDTPTKNMVRALRLFKWQNSITDWARLHITEALLRHKYEKIIDHLTAVSAE